MLRVNCISNINVRILSKTKGEPISVIHNKRTGSILQVITKSNGDIYIEVRVYGVFDRGLGSHYDCLFYPIDLQLLGSDIDVKN